MADIASGDVTYTIVDRRKGEDGRQRVNIKLAFGNGALTYPAGGVPLLKGSMACPTIIESMMIYAKGTSGYEWSFDKVNTKLVALQSAAVSTHTHTGPSHTHSVPSHTHDLHLNDADVADGATTRVNAGTNLLGANTSSDILVAGVADTSGAGGIVAVAAGVSGAGGTGATGADGAVSAAGLAEPSAVAIAAQVLYAEVVGW